MQPSSKRPHLPVLAQEVLSGFGGTSLHTFFDGTLGAGGHARLLLEAHPEIERYIGCDRDADALAIAKESLEEFGSKVLFVKGNYSDLEIHLKNLGIDQVNGFFLTWESRRCNSIDLREDFLFRKKGLSI